MHGTTWGRSCCAAPPSPSTSAALPGPTRCSGRRRLSSRRVRSWLSSAAAPPPPSGTARRLTFHYAARPRPHGFLRMDSARFPAFPSGRMDDMDRMDRMTPVEPKRIRQHLPVLPLLVLATLGFVSASPAAPAVHAVGAIGMTVSDMDRALAFYTQVLPFELVSDVKVSGRDYGRLNDLPFINRRGNDTTPRLRVARLRLGQEFLLLIDYLEPEGRPIPVDARSNDRWFQHLALIVSDMDRAYEQLRAHGVQHVSPGPQTLPDWSTNVAGIRAFYFRDPDGHNLEILWFPPGKGDPRWQRRGDALFLGVDHTAIVVSDTEASLRFYSELLGLEVKGKSENY